MKTSEIFTGNLFKLVLVSTFCFLIGYLEVIDLSKIKSMFAASTYYEADYKIEKENEIIFVYIGSSTCGYCNNEEHYQTIKKFKSHLKNLAVNDNMGFLAIGISKDFNVQEGIKHLNKNGKFDEIMTGNSWHGTGLLKYVWSKYRSQPATPQVLILKRKYFFNYDKIFISPMGVEDESLLIRILGANQIKNFNIDDVKKIEVWES